MIAVAHVTYGPPDLLQLKEIARPVPKDREVLIKVYASTVNRTDCAILRAKPFFMRLSTGLFKPKYLVPGTDFAGIVEEVGELVTSLKAGDRVFGFDDNGLSSKAQFMKFREDEAIAIIPDQISFEQAAASIEGAHYAINFINKTELKTGQHVLVNGASGAIGSAAVQLLNHYDAVVTAVCHTKDMELIKSLGAAKAIDYTREDFTRENQSYHYVFDTVGKSTFGQCRGLLVPGGAYISSELGPLAQNIFFALMKPLMGKRKVLFPYPADRRGSVHYIRKLMQEGKFKPVIDRKYSMDKIDEAYRYVETGQKTGNVVITIAER